MGPADIEKSECPELEVQRTAMQRSKEKTTGSRFYSFDNISFLIAVRLYHLILPGSFRPMNVLYSNTHNSLSPGVPT